jgi:hypothetical protein
VPTDRAQCFHVPLRDIQRVDRIVFGVPFCDSHDLLYTLNQRAGWGVGHPQVVHPLSERLRECVHAHSAGTSGVPPETLEELIRLALTDNTVVADDNGVRVGHSAAKDAVLRTGAVPPGVLDPIAEMIDLPHLDPRVLSALVAAIAREFAAAAALPMSSDSNSRSSITGRRSSGGGGAGGVAAAMSPAVTRRLISMIGRVDDDALASALGSIMVFERRVCAQRACAATAAATAAANAAASTATSASSSDTVEVVTVYSSTPPSPEPPPPPPADGYGRRGAKRRRVGGAGSDAAASALAAATLASTARATPGDPAGCTAALRAQHVYFSAVSRLELGVGAAVDRDAVARAASKSWGVCLGMLTSAPHRVAAVSHPFFSFLIMTVCLCAPHTRLHTRLHFPRT